MKTEPLLFCLFYFAVCVFSETIDWKMIDSGTKKPLCVKNKCNLKSGQSVIIQMEWTFQGPDQVNPEIGMSDFDPLFLPDKAETYFLCPPLNGNHVTTSAKACTLSLKAGTYKYEIPPMKVPTLAANEKERQVKVLIDNDTDDEEEFFLVITK